MSRALHLLCSQSVLMPQLRQLKFSFPFQYENHISKITNSGGKKKKRKSNNSSLCTLLLLCFSLCILLNLPLPKVSLLQEKFVSHFFRIVDKKTEMCLHVVVVAQIQNLQGTPGCLRLEETFGAYLPLEHDIPA